MFQSRWRRKYERLLNDFQRSKVTVADSSGEVIIGPMDLFAAMCCIKYGGYNWTEMPERIGGLIVTLRYEDQ